MLRGCETGCFVEAADRHQASFLPAARAEIGAPEMIALPDRGYYEGEQIRSCAEAGIIPMVTKPNTSPAQARGFWSKAAFGYQPETDTYRCPAGQQLHKRFAGVAGGRLISVSLIGRPAAHAHPALVYGRQRESHPTMGA